MAAMIYYHTVSLSSIPIYDSLLLCMPQHPRAYTVFFFSFLLYSLLFTSWKFCACSPSSFFLGLPDLYFARDASRIARTDPIISNGASRTRVLSDHVHIILFFFYIFGLFFSLCYEIDRVKWESSLLYNRILLCVFLVLFFFKVTPHTFGVICSKALFIYSTGLSVHI